MNHGLLKTALLALLGFSIVTSVEAQVYIYGGISFSGGPIAVDTGHLSTGQSITSFGTVRVTDTTGDYASVPWGHVVTTTTPFTFSPAMVPNPVENLWQFYHGTNSYSFTLTEIQSVSQVAYPNNTEFLAISGLGMLYMTDREPTAGSYIITANSAGQTFSFSAGNSVVPEPGSLALLVLGGILALARRND